jgi:hypothetical protein
MPFSQGIKNLVRLLTKNYYKHLNFLNKLLIFFLIVKKPDVIQKNELYFCNQGSNVIQNQLSKSKHRLKSFVLQACVIKEIPFREDFPCHSTWKRCKHSGHFSRFRNIIRNFCIIKQKCLCNYVIKIEKNSKNN